MDLLSVAEHGGCVANKKFWDVESLGELDNQSSLKFLSLIVNKHINCVLLSCSTILLITNRCSFIFVVLFLRESFFNKGIFFINIRANLNKSALEVR